MMVGRECCISSGASDRPGLTIVLYKLEEFEGENTVVIGMRLP